MLEISPAALVSFILFVLALVGGGAAVPAAVLRANACAQRERAEVNEKQLVEVREEQKEMRRDFRILKEDHEALKDKHIRVLEESRNDLRNLANDVRTELRGIRETLEKH